MTDIPQLDPFSEVVDERRRWLPDWYSWLKLVSERVSFLFSKAVTYNNNGTLNLGIPPGFFVDTTGRATLGTGASPIAGVFGQSPSFEISSNFVGGGADNTLSMRWYGNTSQGPFIQSTKSRGANIGDKTTTLNGDELFYVDGNGYDSTGTPVEREAAYIQFAQEGSASVGSVPGRISIATTPPTVTDPVERVRLDSKGNIVTGIGTGAISVSATDGFLYPPSCAGTPTGTPTAYSGSAPVVVDSSNNRLYLYSGSAWRDVGLQSGLFWVDRNGSNQSSLTSGAYTLIQFNNEVRDDGGWFDSSTNYRFTPQVAGIYFVCAAVHVGYDAVASDTGQAVIFKNGSLALSGNYFWSSGTNTSAYSQVSGLVSMNGSLDFIDARVYSPSTTGVLQ